jgi:hypothetical protein
MLTETPYAFLLTLTMLAIVLRRVASTSVLLTLGTLMRPLLDHIAPFLMLFAVSPFTWKRALKALGLYAAIYVLLMSPWWYHNWRKYGYFVRHNVGGAPFILTENQPIMNSMDVDLSRIANLDKVIQAMTPLWQTPGGFKERDAAMMAAALDYVKTYPGHFIYNCFDRAKRFFNAAMFEQKHIDWWFMLYNLVTYVLCAACLFRAPRPIQRELLPIYVIVGFVSVFHIATHALTRYRAPLDPLFFIVGWGFAGYLVTSLGRRYSTHSPMMIPPAPAVPRKVALQDPLTP